MSKTVISTSTSVDGFIRAAGATPDEPLGKGGERLHHWVFNGTDEDRALLQERPRDASGRRMQRDWEPDCTGRNCGRNLLRATALRTGDASVQVARAAW